MTEEIDPAMDLAKFLNADESSELSWLRMASDGPGNTLFLNDWPSTPDNAARLVRYEGGPPTESFSNPLLIRHPRVQLTVRGKLSNEILVKAGQIMRKLITVKDQTLNGHKYSRIKPVGEPFEIGPDSANRQQAVVNFEVNFYDNL